jgi:photosystem II stability/assembly factor-like uncharacterized protein
MLSPGNDRVSKWLSLLGAIVLGLIFSFSVPQVSGGQVTSVSPGAWVRQSSGTLSWLHSLFFFDRNRGFAVGSKGTLLATTDGGEHWQVKPPPSGDNLRDIYFLDEVNGWVVCERKVYELHGVNEPRAYLMNTHDGGETWQRVDLQGLDPNLRLVRTFFTRQKRGWAFGEAGVLYTSHDGGATWERVQSPTRRLLLGGVFVDEDRGWFVGGAGTIMQTADGGESWHVSQVAAAGGIRFAAAAFFNNRVGWTVGSEGKVYATLNGGRTWQSQDSGVSVDLSDVKFLDANEGWAVGAEGTIIHTTNGGNHWTREPTAVPHPLERVFVVDRQHAWAVGFGGTIVTYVRAEPPMLKQ